ncbi:MAG: ArsR/SmtB family transcription factor [Gaiellaceae bacterium]
MPSAYVWPHVRVNCDPPWPIVVMYAAPFAMREAARDAVPSTLVQTLRAAGDETRLRILKLVGERPRPTEELAPLVNLSEPALSRQLRILHEAGLVRPRRNGYCVLYALEREALDSMPGTLAAFLGGGAS